MHNKELEKVFEIYKTNENGLSEKEAAERLKDYGKNTLKKEKRLSALKIFFGQFVDPLIFLLFAAIAISFMLNETVDAITISVILVINAIIGFLSEYKAEKSLEMLKKLSSLQTKVLRDGKHLIINSEELVPGDIILLEAGDKISADARIIQAANLLIDEATLTGESVPVEKREGMVNKNAPVTDRFNMIFAGTIVVNGRGKAIVTATDMKTELGKIAEIVQETEDEKTPLQEKMSKLSKVLSLGAIGLITLVTLAGLAAGNEFKEIFITAISLAVAAVPEGLPIVVTLTLALGFRSMLKRKALIRKLRAVETLGSTTVICSDKTGTITKNEMTVTEIYANNKIINVSGKGYSIKGEFYHNNKKINIKEIELLLKIGASCNDAKLPNIGDPTEIALLVLAKKGNITPESERVDEVPFDSKKKYMITYHKIKGEKVAYIKGAPERVLEMCKYAQIGNRIIKISKTEREKIHNLNMTMSEKALRVLGIAFEKKKKNIFVGLVGMIDPPREEVKEAIKLANEAGIDVIMLTGDNINTARAIAKQIGLAGEAIEGNDIDNLSNGKLIGMIRKVKIFARVDPEHKVKILEALKEGGQVVAMTGDGVNDAPALKKADVGVAMAIKSTDVAKEASDIVLLDDNFASIVSAVREGRIIFDNMRKFVKYMISANICEIALIFFMALLRFPLPLMALQILWVNLVTDSLPAIALGKDSGEKNIMQRKPRPKEESILKGSLGFVIISGILGLLATAGIFLWAIEQGMIIEKARTLVLTTLIIFEMLLVFSARSEHSLKEYSLFGNIWLIGSVALTLVMQIILLYTPLGKAFEVVPLMAADWIIVIALGSIGFVFFEIKKLAGINLF